MFQCEKCDYITSNKSNYKRHCLTLKHQKNEEASVNCKPKQLEMGQNRQPNVIQMSAKTAKIEGASAEKGVKSEKGVENNNYYCDYCSREYKHRQSLFRHIKKCKSKIEEEESVEHLKELVELLNEQLQEKDRIFSRIIDNKDKEINMLIKKVGINTNTTYIQNIANTQNIQLLSYKQTDYTHLTDEDYKQCISHINFSVPHFIQKVHFNTTKPENHNIYISNLKNKYIMVFDGNKWVYKNQDTEIDDLLDNGNSMLEYKIEDWLEKGQQYPNIMKKFERYMKNIENDDVLNMIKDEIKLLLFNNRNIPQLSL